MSSVALDASRTPLVHRPMRADGLVAVHALEVRAYEFRSEEHTSELQ